MNTTDLNSNEFNNYYQHYIGLASLYSLEEGLLMRLEHASAFYNSIDEAKFDYSYEEGKWTIKEVLQHIIDTERIFAYRALCIARNDKTSFPGFDQDEYMSAVNANKRSKASLIEEYRNVRKATISLLGSLDKEALSNIGTASQSNLSARAAGFIIIGHEIHHTNVIVERYLK
ncbi:MAG: DinB family protein [bacterium]